MRMEVLPLPPPHPPSPPRPPSHPSHPSHPQCLTALRIRLLLLLLLVPFVVTIVIIVIHTIVTVRTTKPGVNPCWLKRMWKQGCNSAICLAYLVVETKVPILSYGHGCLACVCANYESRNPKLRNSGSSVSLGAGGGVENTLPGWPLLTLRYPTRDLDWPPRSGCGVRVAKETQNPEIKPQRAKRNRNPDAHSQPKPQTPSPKP